MSANEPEKFVHLVFEAFGGKEEFFAATEARRAEFNSVWGQDADAIGRILRAHLAVEHFLTQALAAGNPKLGSLDEARLGFYQKVALLGETNAFDAELKQGLLRLNKIRNRIAHTLRAGVTEEDKHALQQNSIFAAMQAEREKRFGPLPADPLSVLEQFAQHAAGVLHNRADPDAEKWATAMKATYLD